MFYMTTFEFSCELFGYDNVNNYSAEIVDIYYADWKRSQLPFDIWKALLFTRG